MSRHARMGSLVVLAVLGAVLVGVGPSAAVPAARETVQKLLAESIAAHGGAEKIAAQRALTIRSEGTLFSSDGESGPKPFSSVSTRLLPDKMRQVIRVGAEGGADGARPVEYVVVYNAGRGWMKVGGRVLELGQDRLAPLETELYVMLVSSLVPLTEEGYELTLTDDPGMPSARVLVVRRQERPEVRLSIDKETKLVVRSEYATTDGANNPVQHECFFQEFIAVGGVKRFKEYNIRRDSELHVQGTVKEYKPAADADASLFTKPE